MSLSRSSSFSAQRCQFRITQIFAPMVFGELQHQLRVQLRTDTSTGFDAKPLVDGGGPKGENVSLSKSTGTIVGRLELEAY